MSFNRGVGRPRGIHAEPWDKLVSVATGRVFACLGRPARGTLVRHDVPRRDRPRVAVFVPRGVGNAYQALEDGTAYSYLVNDHWRPGTTYPALSLGDPTAAIPWPIPLDRADVSEKDRANPVLADVSPCRRRRPHHRQQGAAGPGPPARLPIRRPGGPGGPGRQRPVAVAAWPGTSTQSC